MHSWIKKKKGFSLIEILVTLLILSSSMVIVSRIGSGNQQRVKRLEHYGKITRLMEQKISDLEFEWRRTSFDSIPSEARGDFEGEKHFSWSVVTQALSLPDPKALMSLTGDSQGGMALQVAQVTKQFLSQAVKELKLTIHYKKGSLKSAYSMTTYIVDHNKKIQVSGAL